MPPTNLRQRGAPRHDETVRLATVVAHDGCSPAAPRAPSERHAAAAAAPRRAANLPRGGRRDLVRRPAGARRARLPAAGGELQGGDADPVGGDDAHPSRRERRAARRNGQRQDARLPAAAAQQAAQQPASAFESPSWWRHRLLPWPPWAALPGSWLRCALGAVRRAAQAAVGACGAALRPGSGADVSGGSARCRCQRWLSTLGQPNSNPNPNPKAGRPNQLLVVVPSRELALQIGSVVEQLWPWHGTRRVCVLSGSVSAATQYAQLQTAVRQREQKCAAPRPPTRGRAPPDARQRARAALWGLRAAQSRRSDAEALVLLCLSA